MGDDPVGKPFFDSGRNPPGRFPNSVQNDLLISDVIRVPMPYPILGLDVKFYISHFLHPINFEQGMQKVRTLLEISFARPQHVYGLPIC